MDKAIYDAEMEKLERQQRGLRDMYNTVDLTKDLNDYQRISNSQNTKPYVIKKGETLEEYVKKLEIFVDLAHTKNWKIHVLIGVRGHPWHTHSDASGCFMCDDSSMIHYLYGILGQIAIKYPSLTL